MAIPHGAVGCYAVCDCGVSEPYPLYFFQYEWSKAQPVYIERFSLRNSQDRK